MYKKGNVRFKYEILPIYYILFIYKRINQINKKKHINSSEFWGEIQFICFLMMISSNDVSYLMNWWHDAVCMITWIITNHKSKNFLNVLAQKNADYTWYTLILNTSNICAYLIKSELIYLHVRSIFNIRYLNFAIFSTPACIHSTSHHILNRTCYCDLWSLGWWKMWRN